MFNSDSIRCCFSENLVNGGKRKLFERSKCGYVISVCNFIIRKNDGCCPLPTEESAELYSRHLEVAKRKHSNTHFLGRLGDCRYYEMDKVVAKTMGAYEGVFE
ncbi:hypothetical protein [Methanomethylophilus alvi]|uniref:hypothetical protein n=1 Tax=Methanomethylophilus alvi TaxID=1291540 RepID=UPI0037DD739B